MIKKELLDILACPACKKKIVQNHQDKTLDCQACGRKYPIEDGIPIMLVGSATLDNKKEVN